MNNRIIIDNNSDFIIDYLFQNIDQTEIKDMEKSIEYLSLFGFNSADFLSDSSDVKDDYDVFQEVKNSVKLRALNVLYGDYKDDTNTISDSALLQKEYSALVEQLSEKFKEKLAFLQFDFDINSELEDLVVEIEHKHSLRVLGDVIQTVYVDCYNIPSYMVAICNALRRYDLDEVRPWGIVLISGLINHPDETVQEYVVQLIDNWNDKALLPILSTIEVSSSWLKKYIDSVIKCIGADKCIT